MYVVFTTFSSTWIVTRSGGAKAFGHEKLIFCHCFIVQSKRQSGGFVFQILQVGGWTLKII